MSFSIMGGGKEDQKQETPATEDLLTDSEMQSLPQEIQSLLEQQTEKIRLQGVEIEDQKRIIESLRQEQKESNEIHEEQIRGLREQIKKADARADQTISNAEHQLSKDRREHEDEIARITAELAGVKRRTNSIKAQLGAVGWYSILVTLLAIVFSRSFQWACSEFWSVIQSNVVPAVCLALGTPARIAHLADGIPHEIWSSVVYWTALLWLCGAEIEIVYGCGWLIRRGGKFYRERLADAWSLAVALISLAVAIFFAGPLRGVGINAILMILLINIIYTVWRSIKIYRNRDAR